MAVRLNCGITLNSQNVNANQSTVTAWVDAISTYGSYNHYTSGANAATGSISFGGNASGSYSYTSTFNASTTTRIYTRQFTVNHSADGTARVTFSTSFNTKVSSGTISGSASLTLPTIPRASKVSVSGTLVTGNTITVNTNRASSSFTHTIRMNYGYKDIATYTGVGASVQVPLDTSKYAPQCTDRTSRQLWIYCKTFNGSTQIGEETMTAVDLKIADSVVPTVSALSVSDVNGYYSTYGSRFIQGKSSIKATATAAGAYGSTISKYRFELVPLNNNDGQQVEGTANSQTIGTPTAAGTRTVRVTVTDSRGRTATKTLSVTVSAYSPPTITAMTADRWDATANEVDDESTTVRVSVSVAGTNTIGTVANSYTVVIASAQMAGTPSYTTKGTYTNTGATFTRTANYTGYSVSFGHRFRATVTDKLGSSVQMVAEVGTATPILDFNFAGKDIGVFRVSTHWIPSSWIPGVDTVGSSYEDHGVHLNSNIILYGEKALQAYDTYTDDSASQHSMLFSPVFPSVKRFENFTSAPFYQGATGLSYPWIPTGQYLATGALRGSELDILIGESASGYRQLFLKKGGLRGSVYTRIWSGTYNAQGGSALTIENIDRYNLFAVMVETSRGDQISAVCARRTAEDNIATGCCWWHNVNNYMYMVGVQMRLTSTGVSDMKATEYLHTGGVLSTVWCNSIKNVVGIL